MTKGIEDVDARFSAMRFALRAIVDALADKRVIEPADIAARLHTQEEHLRASMAAADLIDQLGDLRKFLE